MAKHNIKAIAAVCYAAAHVFDQDEQLTEEDYVPLEPYHAMDELTRERWETKVLREIHGEPETDQAGGTPLEQRRARLFSAIVKALTIRL